MKRLFLITILTSLAIVVTSCVKTLPSRFEKFVDKVEQNAGTLSFNDWEEAYLQFEKFDSELNEAKNKLPYDAITRINKAKERFNNAYLVHEFEKILSEVKQNEDSYTDIQWEEMVTKVTELDERYEDLGDTLPLEIKDRIDAAEESLSELYYKHLATNVSDTVGDGIKDIWDKLKEGVKTGVKDLIDNLFE